LEREARRAALAAGKDRIVLPRTDREIRATPVFLRGILPSFESNVRNAPVAKGLCEPEQRRQACEQEICKQASRAALEGTLEH
jgi:hypothetical protein